MQRKSKARLGYKAQSTRCSANESVRSCHSVAKLVAFIQTLALVACRPTPACAAAILYSILSTSDIREHWEEGIEVSCEYLPTVETGHSSESAPLLGDVRVLLTGPLT